MNLNTERCLIRNMMMTDADDLHQVLSDERLMFYIEQTFDLQKTKSFIQSAGVCKPPLVYAIVWKITGKVISHVIFHPYEKNDYEIGWILNKDYWGMGIADEVTKELIKHAKQLGAESVSSNVIRDKAPAKRLQPKTDLYMRKNQIILSDTDLFCNLQI